MVLAQEFPDSGKSLVIVSRIESRLSVFCVDPHRAELIDEERFPVASHPLLTIQSRTAVLILDRQSADEHHRREDQQQDSGQDDIESSLDDMAHQGHAIALGNCILGIIFLLGPVFRETVVRILGEQNAVDSAEPLHDSLHLALVAAFIDHPVADKHAGHRRIRTEESDHIISAAGCGFVGQVYCCAACAHYQGGQFAYLVLDTACLSRQRGQRESQIKYEEDRCDEISQKGHRSERNRRKLHKPYKHHDDKEDCLDKQGPRSFHSGSVGNIRLDILVASGYKHADNCAD